MRVDCAFDTEWATWLGMPASVYGMSLLSALHKFLIHPCRTHLKQVLVLASPSLLCRGGGKDTERLRDLPRSAQHRLGRARFRFRQPGPGVHVLSHQALLPLGALAWLLPCDMCCDRGVHRAGQVCLSFG